MYVFKPALFVTFLLLLFISVRPAMACTCVRPPTPVIALDRADVVFAGKVTHISRARGEYGDVHKVLFRVDAYWKGERGAEIVIETATNSAACGFPFEQGEKYLVYSNISGDALSTTICTRTADLANASEDLADLGTGTEVVVTRSRCGGPTNAAAMQTFLFLFVGMAFMRKRKEKGNI